MRVGIVGTGTIFDAHATAYRELGVTIQAVADVDRAKAEAAARRFEVPDTAGDVSELLGRPDIDVIDVCVPPLFHTPIVIDALRAGKHVVCEKPLSTNLTEIDQILEVERASSGKLGVVHQLRFHPVYQRLKWLQDGGHLGTVCLARVVRYDRPPQAHVEQGIWGRWHQAGGGVVMTKAVHQLDLLLWLMGSAKSVQAKMGTYLFPIESEDHAIATIRFESGALADVCISGFPYGYSEQFDLVGDRGAAGLPWHLKLHDTARVAEISAELESRFPLGARWRRKLFEVFGPRRFTNRLLPEKNLHASFLGAFLAAAEEGRPAPATATDARRAVELCTAIYTAALTGRTVELPLDSSNPYYRGVQKHDYEGSRR